MNLHIPEFGESDVDPLACALAYAKASWYVVPVKQGTKNPGSVLGKDWPSRSTRDPETIASLWAGTSHGIALHVGRSGGVVFDVDHPERLPEWMREELVKAPHQGTRVTSSATGGHYLFRQPPGRLLGNSLGQLPKGWGDVRGANGVIVVYPSMHPDIDNGGSYDWFTTGEVPELPSVLADSLPDASEAAEAVTDAAVSAFLDRHTVSTNPRLLAGWVSGFRVDAEAGHSRHTSMLSRMAGAMKEAAAGYFPAKEAYYALEGTFIAAVSQPGHGQQGSARGHAMAQAEFAAIASWAIGQALAADPAETRARVEAVSGGVLSDDAAWDLEALGKVEAGAEVVSAPEDRTGLPLYLTVSQLQDMPRGEPLIDGIIDRHATIVISGRDQTYKSFFVLDMMSCLATGAEFHGHAAHRTKVLFVVGEGAWGLGHRLAAWQSFRERLIEDEWFHVRRAPVNLFKAGVYVDELVARVEEFGYGLVVFDTLQRNTAGADANSAKDAGMIYASLDRIRNATDRGSVGFVAHTGKDDNDVRGSSAFEDDADIVWRAKRSSKDDTVRYSLTKRKDGPDGLTLALAPIRVDGSLVLGEPGMTPAMLPNPPQGSTALLEVLAAPPFKGQAPRTQLIKAADVPDNGSTVRALRWLEEAGFVSSTSSGGGRLQFSMTEEGWRRAGGL